MIIGENGDGSSYSQYLWSHALEIIPTGNMMRAKHPDAHCRDWPTYFEKAQGCKIWDLSGRVFTDVGLMGGGAALLGYADATIDGAVIAAIGRGNVSTLNCYEDVVLVEKLLYLHPWARKGMLQRSGSEAVSAAVRIARSFTHRTDVAICGFHGWHDFYLAQFLPNTGAARGSTLTARGVPTKLGGSTHAFTYGNIEEVCKLAQNTSLAAIVIDIRGSDQPDSKFLGKLRELANAAQTVLIFDEVTSGFRGTLGGLHLRTGVFPDLVVLSKALGNGYPISAVLGTETVMAAAADTFLSSTAWTERIGPAAGIAVLEALADGVLLAQVETTGRFVKNAWKNMGQSFGLPIATSGVDALPKFTITGTQEDQLQKHVTVNLLEYGFLGRLSFYASAAHSAQVVQEYLDVLKLVLCSPCPSLHGGVCTCTQV